MKNDMLCGCGNSYKIIGDDGILGTQHTLGENGCLRAEVIGSLIPTNFREEIGKGGIKYLWCDVNGYSITNYTLINQRLYNKHPNGKWSCPKDTYPDNVWKTEIRNSKIDNILK